MDSNWSATGFSAKQRRECHGLDMGLGVPSSGEHRHPLPCGTNWSLAKTALLTLEKRTINVKNRTSNVARAHI
jgi:hypothetical protein